MTGPSLVIFDCDGTLVDSQHVIVAAMEMAFAGAGLERPEREAVLSIVGLSLPQAIAQVKAAHAIPQDEALLNRILEGYKNAFFTLRQDPAHEEPMFPGALEGVLELAGRDDLILGIATGKSRRGVDRLLATRIRTNIRLAEAPGHGRTIFEYDPTCHGAEDYRALAAEILGTGSEDPETASAPSPDPDPVTPDVPETRRPYLSPGGSGPSEGSPPPPGA